MEHLFWLKHLSIMKQVCTIIRDRWACLFKQKHWHLLCRFFVLLNNFMVTCIKLIFSNRTDFSLIASFLFLALFSIISFFLSFFLSLPAFRRLKFITVPFSFNFGIFEQNKQGKRDICGKFFRNEILGSHPTKINLHDVPGQNTRQTKCKHPLTIWHGRIESIALQIRCWVRTTGLLRQPFAIAIHLCTPWCIRTFLHFDPLDVNIKTRSVSRPVTLVTEWFPLANWWRHVQGR